MSGWDRVEQWVRDRLSECHSSARWFGREVDNCTEDEQPSLCHVFHWKMEGAMRNALMAKCMKRLLIALESDVIRERHIKDEPNYAAVKSAIEEFLYSARLNLMHMTKNFGHSTNPVGNMMAHLEVEMGSHFISLMNDNIIFSSNMDDNAVDGWMFSI